MAFLEITDLYKKYDSKSVLHGLSLSVEQGEFTCFLGPSGCGKTTLLNCVAGLVAPTAGRIILDGEDISHLTPEKRGCGVVFQNYALFPNLTAGENIAYGLRGPAWSTNKKRQRIEELLDLVELPRAVNSYPHELSGGQQQRVALARALATSPRLLLLDEPLSALDARIRAQLGRELRQLHNKVGITTIMVTHDQQEAMSMADTIVVMRQGHIEQVGAPRTIYAKPATHFVASFVGEMNFCRLPQMAETEFAIRPEDVLIQEATEFTLQQEHTTSAHVIHRQHLGNVLRLTLQLPDFKTLVYAEVPTSQTEYCTRGCIVAVSFPPEKRHSWETPAS